MSKGTQMINGTEYVYEDHLIGIQQKSEALIGEFISEKM